MATTFGKLDFHTSFRPSSAFPLDAREYFESYAEALAAAQKAVEAGSADSNYYYGQVLRVVENGVAALYQIQTNNTLEPVGGGAALEGITARVETLEGAVGGIDDAIAKAVAEANHLKFMTVTSKDAISEVTLPVGATRDSFIYLVPKTADGDDSYDEYMYINDTLELIGHTKVDLTDYAKTADIEAGYVKKDASARLITLLEATKLEAIEEGAQVNKIEQIKLNGTGLTITDKVVNIPLATNSTPGVVQGTNADNGISIGADGTMTINKISQEKISGLEDALEGKVSVNGTDRLITEDEATKLSKLVLNDDGSVGLSGKVNADNVEGLQDLLDEKLNTVTINGEELIVGMNHTVDIPIGGDALGVVKSTNVDNGITINADGTMSVNRITIDKLDIPTADESTLGLVKSNNADNGVSVGTDGKMTVNTLNVNKLVQTTGESIVLYGGSAAGFGTVVEEPEEEPTDNPVEEPNEEPTE